VSQPAANGYRQPSCPYFIRFWHCDWASVRRDVVYVLGHCRSFWRWGYSHYYCRERPNHRRRVCCASSAAAAARNRPLQLVSAYNMCLHSHDSCPTSITDLHLPSLRHTNLHIVFVRYLPCYMKVCASHAFTPLHCRVRVFVISLQVPACGCAQLPWPGSTPHRLTRFKWLDPFGVGWRLRA